MYVIQIARIDHVTGPGLILECLSRVEDIEAGPERKSGSVDTVQSMVARMNIEIGRSV